MNLIVYPMLLNKYKPLAYLLKMRGYNLLAKLMTPIMLLLPVMFLRYYYGLH